MTIRPGLRVAVSLFSVFVLICFAFLSPGFSDLFSASESFYFLTNNDLIRDFNLFADASVTQTVFVPDQNLSHVDFLFGNDSEIDFNVTVLHDEEIIASFSSAECIVLDDGWIRIPLPESFESANKKLVFDFALSHPIEFPVSYSMNMETPFVSDGDLSNYAIAVRGSIPGVNYSLLLISIIFIVFALFPFLFNGFTLRSFLLFTTIIGLALCVLTPFPFDSSERNDAIRTEAIILGSDFTQLSPSHNTYGYWLPTGFANKISLLENSPADQNYFSFFADSDTLVKDPLHFLLFIPLFISGMISLPANTSLLLTRIFVLIVYLFLCSLAIHKAKKFKAVIYISSLAGVFVFHAFLISTASIVFAALLLFISMCAEYAVNDKAAIKEKDAALLFVSYLLCASSNFLILSPAICFAFMIRNYKSDRLRTLLFTSLAIVFAVSVAYYALNVTARIDLFAEKTQVFTDRLNELLDSPRSVFDSASNYFRSIFKPEPGDIRVVLSVLFACMALLLTAKIKDAHSEEMPDVTIERAFSRKAVIFLFAYFIPFMILSYFLNFSCSLVSAGLALTCLSLLLALSYTAGRASSKPGSVIATYSATICFVISAVSQLLF